MLEQQAVNGNFSNKIFFTFLSRWIFNKLNCRIWGFEDPQVIEERPLHPEEVTVWSALWSAGVIEPYFIENDYGTTVTVNSELYGHMIKDFFLVAVEEYDLDNMWFQKDGLICHTTRTNMALVQKTFLGCIISR